MKVVFLAPSVSVHTHKWYAALTREGVDLSVITSHPAGDGSMKEITIGNSDLRAAAYFATAGKVRRAILACKPDIVHAHYATSYGWWGARSRFHPYVLSVWGSDITVTPKRSALARWVSRYNLRAADIVCATSEYLARKASDLCHEVSSRITVVPFGIDTERFKPRRVQGTAESTIVIGTARTLHTIYGLDVLLRSFRKALDKLPNLRLSIAGEGHELRKLQHLAKFLNLGESVCFLGQIPHSDMPAFLNTLDLFVIPSREEAFGVAALEAMSCGVPVIASNVGGLPEILDGGKCGTLVPPDDPSALAHAMIQMLTDSNLRAGLAASGRRRVVEHFAEDRCVRLQMEVYERAMAAKRVLTSAGN